MVAIRSLLFNVLFYAWSALVHILCLPLLLLPYPILHAAGHLWAKGILALLAGICGLRHQVRGLDNLPAEACIIASKHQSAWDILVFPLVLGKPGYVLKRELLSIPLFGWYIGHLRNIPIDRKGGAQALRAMVQSARQVLAEGRYIVIFPEGTRVAPGKHRPYHPGVAALYSQLAVPVVPVAVNSGLYWGRRSFLKKPGRIVLEFLPPILPGLERSAFLGELEERIEQASARLAARARAPA